MELNEEQQTEAVFKSMRSEVDPVSGNEVPPGSLPEEVRDDIPAMLSEGEYVVPADVLRFYGMKFFEDLRNEAKRGLADMESNGRIGGEPVEGPAMSGGEELTPEERAEIESMVMMAVGGYVSNPADMQQQPDPYAQQQAMYNVGKPVAVGNTGFAEGGTVPGDTQVSTADYATRFAPGFTFLEGSNASDFSIVTLYGPSGEVVTLTLPTEQARYDDLLQAGYSTDPAGGAATGVTTETAVGRVEPEGRDGGGPSTDITDRGFSPSTPVGEMNANQVAEAFDKSVDLSGKGAKAGIAAISVLGGPMAGLLAKGVAKLSSNQRTALQSQAEILGLNLESVTDPYNLSRENFVSDDSFNAAMESVAPTGMSFDSEKGSYTNTTSTAPTTSARPQARPGTGSTSSSSSSSGKGLGQSIAESLGFDSFGDMFDGGGRGASASDNDNDSGTSGSGNSGGGANAANDGPGRR